MSNKMACLILAGKLGVEIEIGQDEIVCTAPSNHVFVCRGVHEIVCHTWEEYTTRDLWGDVYVDLSQGVAKCVNSNCDWCGKYTETTK